jgi:uncharacterized protein
MSIPSLSRNSFEDVLRRTLSPTTPIRSAEHLRGREKKLEDIRRALVQPGRHIFIYGDRGVGKTSLAQTAAYEHQSASKPPIFLGCDPKSSFARIAQELASRLLGHEPTMQKAVKQSKGSAGWAPVAVAEKQQSTEHGRVAEPKSVNEATALIGHASARYAPQPVIVIDEFERITDPAERTLFADFIKQAGDQTMPFKLIFCGVGSALDQLLDAHHSCYRYLAAVELERLAFGPCLEIIEAAASACGVRIETSSYYRIPKISDGFPHYVHLITEKLLWEIFEDPEPVHTSTAAHYVSAIRAGVQDIEPKLKATYDTATLKYSDSDEYEAVLWAVADHHELRRRSSDIFDLYRVLSRSRDIQAMARDKFNQRINALKTKSHGSILEGNRQGWYNFREAVMRGYVRLRAEAQGIELGADHPTEYRSPNRLREAPHRQ